jgi:MFS family permease
MSPAQRRALIFIAGSQLLALTLWFSATAVAPQLEEVWGLSSAETAGLTMSVQIGFVVGALGLAMLNLADIVPSRRLFTLSALAGAAVNAGLVFVSEGTWPAALLLRFLTGAALAGVYPAGLKVMAGWFERGRGMALGVLVGALTVGSAAPHLIRGLGFDWQGVVLAASLLTVVAAVVMVVGVSDGPHETASQAFSWRRVGRVVRNRGFRLSTYGYLGHMWELYAMWTWAGGFMAASAAARGGSEGFVPTATFFVIATGGVGAWLFGRLADRRGRTLLAGASLAMSGSVALFTPLLFDAATWLLVAVFLLWGFAVVADSAQFSAMVTETSDDATRGTALALQTSLGFLLTVVTIRGVPLLADLWGWRWSMFLLALGPAFGIWAMVQLRRSPYAAALAGGRG